MILLPIACLALLIGGGLAYFLLIKPAAVEGELSAEPLRGDELAPVLVDKTFADLTDLSALSETLAKQPLQLSSPLIGMEISAQGPQLRIGVRTGAETSFYRVSLTGSNRLEKYLQKQGVMFNKQRSEDLFRDGQKFVTELQKLNRSSEKDPSGLEKYRNTVGLASLVKGVGYHVVAEYQKEIFRCVYEDSEGRLYFLLPRGIRQFKIVARDQLTERHQKFSGAFQVRVSGSPVDLPPVTVAPKKSEKKPEKKDAEEEKAVEPVKKTEDEPPGMVDQPKAAKKKPMLKDG